MGRLGNPNVRKEFLLIYNSTRLQMRIASQVFLTFLFPASKFMLIGLVVFCVYSALRLHGFLALSLGFMGFVLAAFLMMFFSTLAEVHDLSLIIKSEMKVMGLCHGTKNKIGITAPVIRFQMGSIYFVDKMLVLTILRTIVESSITFLVGNPAS